ncbi:VOC family protein [Renibacterium salmoninarum]|uniref:VOC family protein n=1 Tax=Renibacterium salmoninarum TaxID=1646 RepID=UPI0011AB816A|nr:VOC family protein [Renibacterium salmoninarum]
MSAFSVQGPCWVDVMSSDPAAAKDFYGELFGWECTQLEYDGFGDYSIFSKDGAPVGGLGMNSSIFSDSWTTYLSVDDLKAAQASVSRHGGTVLMPTMDHGEFGKTAVAMGPGEAVLGPWQRKSVPGFHCPDAPGYPIWHTLNTYRFDAVFEFYCTAMEWTPRLPLMSTSIRYGTFQTGNTIRAAILDATAAGMTRPSRWWISFGPDDVDATVAEARKAGGQVLCKPVDTFSAESRSSPIRVALNSMLHSQGTGRWFHPRIRGIWPGLQNFDR